MPLPQTHYPACSKLLQKTTRATSSMQMSLDCRIAAHPTQLSDRPFSPGRKDQNKRVTCLLRTNVDDTERLPPLVVGRARRPRCFDGRNAAELGFDYDFGLKSWMSSIMFMKWICRVDQYVGRTPVRTAVLFIGNASCHGTESDYTFLQNLRIYFLPKRTTALLQPLNLGIIAAVKKHYERKQAQRAVDLLESGITEHLYEVDLKLAINWIMIFGTA